MVRALALSVVFVVFVAIGVEPLPAAAQESAVEALVGGARCEPMVRQQLRAWGADYPRALPEPAGPTGARSVRLPTGAMGIWLRVSAESPRELTLERITSTRIERLRYDPACAVGEFAVATPPVAPDAFTDSELITRVARGGRGVFLLWSPHMPLSVDQHAVLAGVAREFGLMVVPLLDPGAEADYAARVARERDLPREATRPLGGIELAFRGMTTHTPSLQLFAGGQLIGPVLYGYRNAEALRAILVETLSGR